MSPACTLGLCSLAHVGYPVRYALSFGAERQNVGVRGRVVPAVGGDSSLLVLEVVDDLADLGVGEVTRGVGALAGLGVGHAEASGKGALRAGTFGIGHSEAAAVAGDSDDDLGGVDSGLGDHGEGVEGLGLVDVGAEAVSLGAARTDVLVAVV